MTNLTDQQLLVEYAERRSETAFGELVRRHLDLIYSAALRMVCDSHLAEDVTQSAFVALARSAPKLTGRTVLTGWLHLTAQNIVAQTVRTDVRRRAREKESAAMSESFASEPDALWEYIAPHLDAALGDLNDAERDALLLRYFERKTAREMAQVLGVTDETAQKRVSRAVERLREFFAKRHITVTSSGLVAVISENAIQAAPVALAATISTAALLGGTALITSKTAIAVKAIVMTTPQKILITLALAATVGTGVYQGREASSFRNRANQQTALNEKLQGERDGFTRQLAALSDENEHLKRDTADLMRLRGEVSRLRQELAAAPKALGPADQPLEEKEKQQTHEPVRHFVAGAQTTVPAGQTLAFGGWSTAPGKLTLAFVKPGISEPNSDGQVASIGLESRFVEFPEEMLAKVASDLNLPNLNKLKTDGLESSTHVLFTAEEAGEILQILESNARTLVIAAPKIETGDGRSAIVSSTEQKTIDGQEYELGPSLEVEPQIDPDGSSVKLNVTARLNSTNPVQNTAQ